MKFEEIKSKITNPFFSLPKKTQILIVIIFVLFFIDVGIVIANIFAPKYTSSALKIGQSEEEKKMLALNSCAKRGTVFSKKYAFYKFTKEQQQEFSEFYRENGDASVYISVCVPSVNDKKYMLLAQDELPFYFGFLMQSDFDKRGRFLKDVSERVLSGTDLRNFLFPKSTLKTNYFENALAVTKNLSDENLPVGFFVYSSIKIKINSVKIQQVEIGFDITRQIPFYGVSPNGGAFGSLNEVDFSGATLAFSATNSFGSVMPRIELENISQVELNAGGENLKIYASPQRNSSIIQTSCLKNPFSRFEIMQDENEKSPVQKLIMRSNEKNLAPQIASKVLFPLKNDPGLVLLSKANWRSKDYELYEWDKFPKILFFDTKDYKVQSDFFTRLAFFVEKANFKGRILTDEELGDMHGYNAHDYSSESLARFFTEAQKIPNVLNEKELLLKEILLKNEIIVQNEKGDYEQNFGAVISISQQSQNWLRQSLCTHEMFHGIFFTNEDFRNATAAIYYTIDEKSIDFMRGYWKSQKSLGYDLSDDYLMHNEFMAYIMQQPLSSVKEYFIHLSNRGSVMNEIPDLCNYVRSTKGISFEDAARIFDSYVFDNWGLNCGRVAMIVRQ